MNFIEQLTHPERAGVREPWKPGADAAAEEQLRMVDPTEQVQRCLHCPYPECKNHSWCRYRREGVTKNRAPKGYDRVKIEKALPKVYMASDLAPVLGVSTEQARVCLRHYYEEVENK